MTLGGHLEDYLAAHLPALSDELLQDPRPTHDFLVQRHTTYVPVSPWLLLDFVPRNEWPIWAKKEWLQKGYGEGRVECRDGLPNRSHPRIVWHHPKPIMRLVYPTDGYPEGEEEP
jgi:hypothetical protein